MNIRYGAGDVKIGTIIFGLIVSLQKAGLDYKPLADKFFKGSMKPNEKLLRECGRTLKDTFIKRTPGLDKLVKAVKSACARGYLIGLDGRRLRIRSDHAALNTLLQSAGALVCKRWMVEVDYELTNRDRHNMVQQLIWYHDELQFDVTPDFVDEFKALVVECIKRAADYFSIRVPLDGEAKPGANWAQCH